MIGVKCDICFSISTVSSTVGAFCGVCGSTQLGYAGNAECLSCGWVSVPPRFNSTFQCPRCPSNVWNQSNNPLSSVPIGPSGSFVAEVKKQLPIKNPFSTGSKRDW